jgi:hypothetical protein
MITFSGLSLNTVLRKVMIAFQFGSEMGNLTMVPATTFLIQIACIDMVPLQSSQQLLL